MICNAYAYESEKIILCFEYVGDGEIERTDKEIDEMVFDLYGLSEEERRVVEGK